MRKSLSNLLSMYDTFGRFVVGLGLVALAASAAMAFFFGVTISLTHGVFLVVLSVVAALGPHMAHKVYNISKPAGVALAIICAPLLVIEFYTHAGYTAGLRGVNIGDAKVQQVRYNSAHAGVTEERTNYDLWRKQLAELEAANGWAGTVTATGLRDQLPAMDEAIRQETKRGGCGPKCLALTKDRANIAERIAIAERREDLSKRIEATRVVLAKERAKAEKTEFKHSSAAHQAEFLGKLVALVGSGELKPSDFQGEAADQSVNMAMALAGTGLPALCFFIAGFFMVSGQSSRERLEAFLDNVNRHARHLGQPEFKVA